MIDKLTPLRAALIVALCAAATIGGAWLFQLAGYPPCELCLKQRYAYYAGVPLALVLLTVAARGKPKGLIAAGLVLLALVFAANAVLGAYHAGVEWGIWPGPAECSGPVKPPSFADFQSQLSGNSVKVVRCDAAALRILGLSLAGWNALISFTLAVVAAIGATRTAAPLRL